MSDTTRAATSPQLPRIDMTAGANALLFADEQFIQRWQTFDGAPPWALLHYMAHTVNALADAVERLQRSEATAAPNAPSRSGSEGPTP